MTSKQREKCHGGDSSLIYSYPESSEQGAMAHVVVLFQAGGEIRDCMLFTRQCGHVQLDMHGRPMRCFFPLRQHITDFWKLEDFWPSTQTVSDASSGKTSNLRPHRKYSHIVFHVEDTVSVSNSAGDRHGKCSKHTIQQQFSGQFLMPTRETYRDGVELRECRLFVLPRFTCTMSLNGHVAGCLLKCLRVNQRFRRTFCKRLLRGRVFRDCVPQYFSWGVALFEHLDLLAVRLMIEVIVVWPEQLLDYTWGWRLNNLLTKRMKLDEAMAWLSTLGGAHSSLGEYFQHHAEMAGQISVKQLRLALEMGDPFTVGRCHMFWAYSLIQRGHARKAKVIVRRVHSFAACHPVRDTRLINMCLAAWKRLQHLHRAHRQAWCVRVCR